MKHPNSLKNTTHKFCKIVSASALLGALTLTAAQAGTETVDSKSAKDKNIIQPPAPKTPRFYLTIQGGSELDYNATKYLSDGGGHLLGDPAHIDSRSFPKLHDGETQLGELTAGYIINPIVSVFARFDYNHAYRTRESIGSVKDTTGTFGTNVAAILPVSADLNDFNSYGGKGGVKITLPPIPGLAFTNFLKPYATFAAGGTYDDHVNANLDVGGVGVGDARIYRSSWVFSTDGRLGLEYDITKCIALNLEGGIGYDTKPQRAHGTNSSHHASTESLGLTGVSQGGDRLYSPVTAGVKFSF